MNPRERMAKRREEMREHAKTARSETGAVGQPHERISDMRKRHRERLEEMRMHPENLVKVDGEARTRQRERMEQMRENMRKRVQ